MSKKSPKDIKPEETILPTWQDTVNETFIPLLHNTHRYLICYGGRGSSKSVFAATKLIMRCLTEPYFRYILYRRTYNTIRDSQYQTIKDLIEDWGLEHLFHFTRSPLEITCHNGNKFICRGGDEPKKLKSIKDPTGVWYEEEIPAEGDFITITTSIRTGKAPYLQEILTINPEVEGDYRLHWFWQRFFKDKPQGTFSDAATIALADGTPHITTYTCHHSTWQHNRWLPPSFQAQLMMLHSTNPYYYTIYALGQWGNKTTEGNFYKLFDRIRNTRPEVQCIYNPDAPLHLTFDFNVHPYVTLCIWQVAGRHATQVDELCLATPHNRTDMACRRFLERYHSHRGGIYIYGDPAGMHEDTRTEKGYNDFHIIMKELARYRPVPRWQRVAPPVHIRGMFINAIFETQAHGITLTISDRCTHTITDYMQLKEAADGRKDKTRIKHPQTGITYEQYGHTSDANDYFICALFLNEFTTYQRGDVVYSKPLYKPRTHLRL